MRGETTGGTAFSTWLNLFGEELASFRAVATSARSSPTAPDNLVRSNLSNVAILLDATEVKVESNWKKDAASVLYSPYKGKPTKF